MATQMGAPGVRIELHDRSGYSLVENPNAVGGVVGFAPRGELNKIQLITNTNQQDMYFGLGFNNSRFNQGLYASRAVIGAGGHTEFVRPYGEEIDKTDDMKRDLKTDTFVVAYDRNAANNPNNPTKDSIKVDYFASTRYKTDGAAKYGVTRKINNIAETIVNNSNVNFNLDAAEDYNAEENWAFKNGVANGGVARGKTDMVMFALMNADPSAAGRAYSSFPLETGVDFYEHDSGSKEITVTCRSKVGFAEDEIVYGPAAGRVNTLTTFRVVSIDDKKVKLEELDTDNLNLLNYRPEVLIYSDPVNAVADGFDAVTVKTAVSGQGAKTFNALHIDDAGLAALKETVSGTSFSVCDENASEFYIRIATKNTGRPIQACKYQVTAKSNDSIVIEKVSSSPEVMWVGDTVNFEWEVDTSDQWKNADFIVTGISIDESTSGNEMRKVSLKTVESVSPTDLPALQKYGFITTKPESWVDAENTLTPLVVTDDSTAASVVKDLAEILHSDELGFGTNITLADIAKDADGLKIDDTTLTLTAGGAIDFAPGDYVAISMASKEIASESATVPSKAIFYVGKVRSSDPITDTVELYDAVKKESFGDDTDFDWQLINLSQSNKVAFSSAVAATTGEGEEKTVTGQAGNLYLVGNFTLNVPVSVQSTTARFTGDVIDNVFKYEAIDSKGNSIVERSEKVLADSAIGATFVSLGLANIQYADVNFSGNTVKVYDLTDEGEAIARLYMAVAYTYDGVRYEFDGTVVHYVYNDRQLFIGDTAELELEGTGVKFVLNDSGVMEMFREDNSYDLSNTVRGELRDGAYKAVPCGSFTCPAFNEKDPAIIHNAVWTYDPLKNGSTSTISNAYNLFLDKDKSNVSYFVTAGFGVSNFGIKGYEILNTQLMQAVLNLCELRKDCFALFDGVAESRIEAALKANSPASRFGSTLGRWGAIYDARPIFHDSVVTRSNVELAPSVAMAALITANRSGSVYWHIPAGESTGMIPGAWCRKVKYERRFNIPEDPTSDIARLCDIHVNPFRTNRKGIYAYGDFTMQMEDTAFNAINVTMLVAQIHKMFYSYLDSRVFKLNTAELRAEITIELQSQLDKIIGEHPAGLEPGSVVICDDSNNQPEVVEAHKLFVDLMLYPTTSTRYIYLRTNVLSRAGGNVITTTIRTGER